MTEKAKEEIIFEHPGNDSKLLLIKCSGEEVREYHVLIERIPGLQDIILCDEVKGERLKIWLERIYQNG